MATSKFECVFGLEEIDPLSPHILLANLTRICADHYVALLSNVLRDKFLGFGALYHIKSIIAGLPLNYRKPISKKLRDEILRVYRFSCVVCRKTTDLTIDHKVALANGGDNRPTNLQVMCRSCNSRKGKRAEAGMV